jgi:hypothetical protein
VRNILRRTLALGLLTGLGFMAAAPAAFASTSIEAYGIQATGLVSLTKQPDATLGTPSPSNVASATVGLLLTTGVLHAAVSQGSGTETATATVASVGSPLITGLGLTTGVITTTCTANDGETTTGSVNIVNLVFGTNSLTGNIAPSAEGAPLVSGAGLKLGLGLLACGGLTGALIWMRRLRTSQPA